MDNATRNQTRDAENILLERALHERVGCVDCGKRMAPRDLRNYVREFGGLPDICAECASGQA